TGQVRAQPTHGFAQDPLDPVAADGALVNLARDRLAQAGGARAGQPVQAEQRIAGAAATLEHAGVIDTRTDPGAARESRARVRGHCCRHRGGHVPAPGRGDGPARDQALRRLRPLARRRARILRPPTVFIRARKPWSRLRLRLLGWYVRLVAMATL